MYLSRLYAPQARHKRIQYAVRTILRDSMANEGAFRVCFEMEDQEEVIGAILRRGLRNRKLRAALRASHLIDLTSWLARNPELAEAYARLDE